MTDKLLSYGGEVFDTYELLEMLLYRVIPYKDTNPMAKLLLQRFESLDGVLTASIDELCKVSGIGKASAEYIKKIGTALSLCSSEASYGEIFTSYDALGKYLTEILSGENFEIYLLLFDGGMHLISKIKLYECDFSSAAVRPEAFITPAVRSGATAAVIAHSHPYGPLFASEGDYATNVLIRDALLRVGIPLLEHYIISGGKYIGFIDSVPPIFERESGASFFIESKGGYDNG
jgi:DNA repair protein RadC